MKAKGRLTEAAMIAPTLRNPDVVIVEPSEAKQDSTTSRPYSLIFAKTFNRNGKKIKFYQSVSIDIDGEEIINSNHYISSRTQFVKKMLSGRLLINKASLSNSSEWHLAEDLNGLPDLLPTQENDALSTDKGTNNSEISFLDGTFHVQREQKGGGSVPGQRLSSGARGREGVCIRGQPGWARWWQYQKKSETFAIRQNLRLF